MIQFSEGIILVNYMSIVGSHSCILLNDFIWFGQYPICYLVYVCACRVELLSMVKKHSQLIGWTVVEAEDDPSDVEMDDKFWHEMLDLFFVRGRVSKSREEDDLVFFVNNMVPFSLADFSVM